MPQMLSRKFALLSAMGLLYTAQALTFSIDSGVTWLELDAAESVDLPERVLVRATTGEDAPRLRLPRCAIEPGLRVAIVRLQKGGPPIGLKWVASPGCEGQSEGAEQREEVPQEVPDIISTRIKPQWHRYVRMENENPGEKEPKPGKQKGMFSSKYLLYIMGFIAVALAQGIRRGFAELREEMEREEQEKRDGKGRAAQGQIRVTVPQRKKAAKGKRRGSSVAGKAASAK